MTSSDDCRVAFPKDCALETHLQKLAFFLQDLCRTTEQLHAVSSTRSTRVTFAKGRTEHKHYRLKFTVIARHGPVTPDSWRHDDDQLLKCVVKRTEFKYRGGEARHVQT